MVSEGNEGLPGPTEMKFIGNRLFVLHEDGRVSIVDNKVLVQVAPGGGPGRATFFCGWRIRSGFLFLVARWDKGKEATFRLSTFPTRAYGR